MGTDQALRSKYNGRLTDNLLQWASDEMNQRLPLDATGDQLITLSKQDLENAIVRFTSARPPVKKDPTLWGGERVEQQLKLWNLEHYSVVFVRAGYRGLTDLCELDEQKIRKLGVEVDADVRRVVHMVTQLQQQRRAESNKMDALYMDVDMVSIRAWLEKRGLSEWAPTFETHQVTFEILGDLNLELLKEMGLVNIGPRLAVYRAIEQWRDEREHKKAEAIRARLEAVQVQELSAAAAAPAALEMEQRIAMLKSRE